MPAECFLWGLFGPEAKEGSRNYSNHLRSAEGKNCGWQSPRLLALIWYCPETIEGSRQQPNHLRPTESKKLRNRKFTYWFPLFYKGDCFRSQNSSCGTTELVHYELRWLLPYLGTRRFERSTFPTIKVSSWQLTKTDRWRTWINRAAVIDIFSLSAIIYLIGSSARNSR